MSTNQKVGGFVTFLLDGVKQKVRGNFKVRIGNPSRETVKGGDGEIQGYIQKAEAPGFDMDLTDTANLSLKRLGATVEKPMTVELDNGKVYQLPSAWVTNALELDAEQGQVTVNVDGTSCEEVQSNG